MHRRNNLGDIYLVIKNENVMKSLLIFLIHSLETLNGNRGSAVNLIKTRIKELKIKDLDEHNELTRKDESYDLQARHEVARIVLSKYRLMIVRMKLSYQCLIQKATITELWLQQIITSFRFLRDSE